ncbi:hypothetical protein KOR34_17290 [Posidoniimonas corsicana]|uniref:Ice-binding protein C-terminal domain-containing protein n=1 Tax=Posidoniimonas corsicana TaxID=1938618 RepID=A0A5C5VFW1_9BACT|nr:PEP-CTERM sorting domain-containing protein [Posidoniimonas corsicana]TWT36789.1 hypothetical protein KOR34_17290 [Posidoniimonas corsicana]
MKMSLFRSLCAAALLLVAGQANADHLSLIITGAFDGPLPGGIPKVVELYAAEDIPDLSRWAVGAANNGGGSDGFESVLAGSASAGDFMYIVSGTAEFASYFAGEIPAGSLVFDTADGTSGGAASINGDDALEVFFDSADDGTFATVGDTFGELDVDGTGQPWDYLDGWAYRKSGTAAVAGTFVLDDWTYSGVDANDGKTTNVAPNAFPIGTYNPVPEPASAALALLGVAAIGLRRRNG